MEQNDKLKDAKRSINARLLLLAVGIMLVVNGAISSGRTGLNWLSLAKLVTETQAEQASDKAEATAAEPAELTEETTEAAAELKEEAGKPEEASAISAEGTEAAETAAGSDEAAEAGETAAVSEGTAEGEETAAASEAAAGTEETAATPADGTGDTFDVHTLMEEMDKAGLTVKDLRIFGIFFVIAAVLEVLVGLICALLSNRVDKSKITFTATIILVAWELIFVIFLMLRGGLMLSTLLNSLLLPAVLLWAAWQMRKMAKADPERILAVKPNSTPVRKPAAPAPKKSIKERANWTSQTSQTEEDESEGQVP